MFFIIFSKELLNDPVLFVTCGHTICKCCFSNSCPICGTLVNNEEQVKENAEFKTILEELNVLKNVLKDVILSMKENVLTESNEQSNVLSGNKETPGPLQCSTPVNTKKRSSTKTKNDEILLKENCAPAESMCLNEQLNVLSEKTASHEDNETPVPVKCSTPVNTKKRPSTKTKNDEISLKENGAPAESMCLDEQSNVLLEKTASHEDKEAPVPIRCSTPVNTRKRPSTKTKNDEISLKENGAPAESMCLDEQLNVPSEETASHEDKEAPVPVKCSSPISTRKRSSSKTKDEEISLKENGILSKSNKQSNTSEKTVSKKVKETLEPVQCSTPINTRKRSSSRICNKFSCCETKNKVTPVNQSDVSNSSIHEGRKKSDARKPSTSFCPDIALPLPSPATNLNKKNPKGETPLHRAVIRGDISKVKEYINQGASVNTQDNNGWTPLHEASNHGYFDIAKLLLDHGALVNVPSLKDNITPLHDALLNDQLDIAILLASRGADLHTKASFGYCALDLCKTDETRRSLTEACSPFIEANTIMPISKNTDTESDKIVFLYSNLNDEQKIKLQKCAQLLKAEIVEEFKPNVTHIVTGCDNMGNCTRTMKVLLGMISGKWLINFQWVEVCLEYKKKVEEEVFEVQGTKNQPNTQAPARARKNTLQKFPPLFDGFYFYLHGTFSKPTPLREDLCNLIHMGGGKLLSREPKPDTVSSEAFMMPYHAAGTSLENINHIILYQDKPPRNVHLNSGHICTSQVMWLISCINEYSLLPPKQANVAD
nr:BRCA1-associated RING domain protein 1 [Parasteatoda tepidariorum]